MSPTSVDFKSWSFLIHARCTNSNLEVQAMTKCSAHAGEFSSRKHSSIRSCATGLSITGSRPMGTARKQGKARFRRPIWWCLKRCTKYRTGRHLKRTFRRGNRFISTSTIPISLYCMVDQEVTKIFNRMNIKLRWHHHHFPSSQWSIMHHKFRK